MSQSIINVLMTGGGAPGAAGILNCLKQESSFQVTVADADPLAVGRWLSKDFEVIPPAISNEFLDSLLALVKKKNINIILPLVTKELLPLSESIDEFDRAGCKVIVSSSASLKIANNKCRVYEFLKKQKIDVPDFRTVKNIPEFQNAVTELNYPAKPICFKPAESNGSRGFRIISNKINELDLLLNQKPGSAFINLENAIRILSSGKFPELLISEYLPGDEYSVDCLAKNGKAVMIVPRNRKKTINGISVAGEFVKNEAIINYCAEIISVLNLHGNIGIQVKQNEDGRFLILEINPRVHGTISAALGAGVNLPVLAIKQELGLPASPDEFEVKWGTRFSRYWEEVFY